MTHSRIFKGMIVEESLTDNRILNGLEFIDVRITESEKPEDRWHIYTIKTSQQDIGRLQSKLRTGNWYMHFWADDLIVAVFPKKVFEFHKNRRDTWQPAIDYGLSLGIPIEQLDFLTV